MCHLLFQIYVVTEYEQGSVSSDCSGETGNLIQPVSAVVDLDQFSAWLHIFSI